MNPLRPSIRTIPLICRSSPNAANASAFSSEVRRNFGYSSARPKPTQKHKPKSAAQATEEAVESYGLGLFRKAVHSPKSSLTTNSVDIANYHPLFLRDACRCPSCVDPSTKQKRFQTTDIPHGIRVHYHETLPDGSVKISWENDIPSFIYPTSPEHHDTILPASFFSAHATQHNLQTQTLYDVYPRTWDKTTIARELVTISYGKYINNDLALYKALWALRRYGLVIINDVSNDHLRAVEKIADRIGLLRDSFYGRTWDVKAVPEAKNVAYTAQNLGLHMDLLYMSTPPGLQLLHCIENTCEGGESVFSDTAHVVRGLKESDLKTLREFEMAFEYRNNGQHYYFKRPVLEEEAYSGNGVPRCYVNYSPPFQAPFPLSTSTSSSTDPDAFPTFLTSFRNLASAFEREQNVFEHKLQPGECVIFNNRRVLHGRKAFDTANGKRWLKGAYVDSDVWLSRYRTLREEHEVRAPGVVKEHDRAGRRDWEADSEASATHQASGEGLEKHVESV